MLYAIIQSQLLYAITAWIRPLDASKYKDGIEELERRAILRVVHGYRTVSGRAVHVIAGILRIALVPKEQRKVFHFKEKQSIAEGSDAQNMATTVELYGRKP